MFPNGVLAGASQAVHTRIETSSRIVECEELTSEPHNKGRLLEQAGGDVEEVVHVKYIITDEVDDRKEKGELGEKQFVMKNEGKTPRTDDLSRLSRGGMTVEEVEGPTRPEMHDATHKLGVAMVVEEPDSDREEHIIKVNISRGVSIVSLTEDEPSRASLSRGVSREDAVRESIHEQKAEARDAPSSQEGLLLDKETIITNDLPDGKSVSVTSKVSPPTEQEARQLEKGMQQEETSPSARKKSSSSVEATAPEKDPRRREECLGFLVVAGGSAVDDDSVLDPEVAALLKRVRKQRSVLEEILDKEGERKLEGRCSDPTFRETLHSSYQHILLLY
ncbi:hypothetical protein PR048_026591 [Dryococelus australis]|uniref:Uncharacterized protein n=1 Tax=Dryococelus australis TaxID=614101 RepID=A0ABQ9GLT5_9NEOP|nr:hypothetical protein PR048_026591 [Dryococelus australis]